MSRHIHKLSSELHFRLCDHDKWSLTGVMGNIHPCCIQRQGFSLKILKRLLSLSSL